MPVSDAISAQLMAGGAVTTQAVADFAKDAYDAMTAAMRAGRHDEAREHEAEFDRLCALFQSL